MSILYYSYVSWPPKVEEARYMCVKDAVVQIYVTLSYVHSSQTVPTFLLYTRAAYRYKIDTHLSYNINRQIPVFRHINDSLMSSWEKQKLLKNKPNNDNNNYGDLMNANIGTNEHD